MTKYRLPFDLPPQQFHFLSVDPASTAAMLNGEPAEVSAIEKIAMYWTARADKAKEKGGKEPAFGVELPIRYGFGAKERKTLTDTTKYESQQADKGLELVKKIAAETDKKIGEVQQILLSYESRQLEDLEDSDFAILTPYLRDLIDARVTPDSYEDLADTLHMKRAIHDWTLEDTLALHPTIRQSLADFRVLEEKGAQAEESKEGKD